MEVKEYVEKIEKIEKELEELRDVFSKAQNLTTDWNKMRVEPLLNHIRLLLEISRQFPNSLNEEIIKSDVDYFEYNINGLNRQLG